MGSGPVSQTCSERGVAEGLEKEVQEKLLPRVWGCARCDNSLESPFRKVGLDLA